jgi:hypothetical protein
MQTQHLAGDTASTEQLCQDWLPSDGIQAIVTTGVYLFSKFPIRCANHSKTSKGEERCNSAYAVCV